VPVAATTALATIKRQNVGGVQMFERETSREKNLEKAAKEAKIKARKEAGKGNEVVEKKMTEADLQQVRSNPFHLWHVCDLFGK
jgi:hypothetical protein